MAPLAPFVPPLGPQPANPHFYSDKQQTLQMKEKVFSLSGDDFIITTVEGIEVCKCKGKVMSISDKKSEYSGFHPSIMSAFVQVNRSTDVAQNLLIWPGTRSTRSRTRCSVSTGASTPKRHITTTLRSKATSRYSRPSPQSTSRMQLMAMLSNSKYCLHFRSPMFLFLGHPSSQFPAFRFSLLPLCDFNPTSFVSVYADNCQVKGDWWDRSAEITYGGRAVAHISRSFLNYRQIFGDKQTYFVTVAPGVDLTMIAGLCVCLDEKENEK